DFGPAHGFRLDEAVKRLGRAFADRNELKADKLLFDLGLGDGRIHRAVELGDDLRWRAARRCDRLPGRPVEAGDADVGERRVGRTPAGGGRSGAAGGRCAGVTPSARSLPAWISG